MPDRLCLLSLIWTCLLGYWTILLVRGIVIVAIRLIVYLVLPQNSAITADYEFVAIRKVFQHESSVHCEDLFGMALTTSDIYLPQCYMAYEVSLVAEHSNSFRYCFEGCL